MDITIDRPAIILEIIKQAKAVFTNFGSDSEPFLDIMFGISAPEGKLPFDMPRSIEAVKV
jgi:antitoxin component of RelBE/YafQ-DinJ toxin-antitoxin module